LATKYVKGGRVGVLLGISSTGGVTASGGVGELVGRLKVGFGVVVGVVVTVLVGVTAGAVAAAIVVKMADWATVGKGVASVMADGMEEGDNQSAKVGELVLAPTPTQRKKIRTRKTTPSIIDKDHLERRREVRRIISICGE
jgi:hypothetical protein